MSTPVSIPRCLRSLAFAVLGAGVIGIGNASTPASQVGDPLTAQVGAVDAQFGNSVSVGGTLAIVGAPYRRLESGIRAGAAYVFDLTTRQQLHELSDANLADGAAFGFRVAIDGDMAIIGAPGDDHGGTAAGSAYVFNVLTGELIRKITLEEGRTGDLFGHDVALQDGLAVIGAPGDDHNPREDPTGAVYVFDIATGDLALPRLAAADPEDDQLFGWSVTIDGDNILAGAPDDDGACGAVYVFDRSTGTQVHKLRPSDPDRSFLTFGHSVALSGTVALIGAPGDGHAGSSAGSAYLFDAGTGQQLDRVTAEDSSEHDAFGLSVALDGNLLLIGASGGTHAGDNAGSAYLFETMSGQQIRRWVARDASAQVRFGHAVSINGDRALVGAILHDSGIEDAGAAYVFEYCRADIDEDRTVAFPDLIAVLSNWGPCDTECPQDIDGDMFVGFGDLLEVLATWGPCV